MDFSYPIALSWGDKSSQEDTFNLKEKRKKEESDNVRKYWRLWKIEKPFSTLNYGKQLIICIPSNEIPCHSLAGPNYTGLYYTFVNAPPPFVSSPQF